MELQKSISVNKKCLTVLATLFLCAINTRPTISSLQSVSMALLSTAAIIYFITQIINFRTAVMAALTWSTSLAFIRFSQSAQLAMTLTSLITIAMLSIYSSIAANSKICKAIYLLIFALSVTIVLLTKNIQPGTTDERPFFYFFPILLIGICPWIAIFPMALIAPFQKAWQQKRKLIILLWTWFALAFVYASAKQTKAPQTILPAIPPIAILIGMVLEDLIFTQKVYSKRFATVFFQYHITAVLFGAIGAAAFASGKAPHMLPQFIILMITTLTLAATIVLLFMKNMRIAATAVIFASVSLLAITVLTLLAS